MTKHNLKPDEATFSITGRIRIFVIITIIGSLLSFGGMIAKINILTEQVNKLEQKATSNNEDHTKILGTLISIQENTKFLKEKIEDLKAMGVNK